MGEDVCRTCLTKNIKIKPLFAMEEICDQQMVLSEILMACAAVSVTEDDNLPKTMCLPCIEDLRNAYSFKIKCEKSDEILRESKVAATSDLVEIKEVDLEYDIIVEVCDEENINEVNTECKFEVETLRTEMRSEDDKLEKQIYECKECDQTYLESEAYFIHLANIHGSSPKQKQDISSETSQKKRVKKTKSPHICEICNKSFRIKSKLDSHKLVHTGEKMCLCNVCGKSFSRFRNLKLHSYTHTGEKPYKCPTCDKSFSSPSTLKSHVRIHTGERPYVCKLCGKGFIQCGELTAHMQIHTGEKPVKCEICQRRFPQKGRLTAHMRIHTGERPHSCPECGKRFTVTRALREHVRTHTGEKPFLCSQCGKAFAHCATLVKHRRVHKPRENEAN